MEGKPFLDGITSVIVRAEEVFSNLWIVEDEVRITSVNDLSICEDVPSV
jgi:hypothetical protein